MSKLAKKIFILNLKEEKIKEFCDDFERKKQFIEEIQLYFSSIHEISNEQKHNLNRISRDFSTFSYALFNEFHERNIRLWLPVTLPITENFPRTLTFQAMKRARTHFSKDSAESNGPLPKHIKLMISAVN